MRAVSLTDVTWLLSRNKEGFEVARCVAQDTVSTSLSAMSKGLK